MPAMRVWLDSASVLTRKVGSSSASRWRAIDILSWSAFVFGSTASSMTGSGKVIDSSTTGLSSAVSVSPVVVFLRPTAAAMSPALTWSISSRWLACIWRMRPTRSFSPFVLLNTYEPVLSVPE